MCVPAKWLCSVIKVPPHFQKEKTLLGSSLTTFKMSLDLGEVCKGKHQPSQLPVLAQALPSSLLVSHASFPPHNRRPVSAAWLRWSHPTSK